MFSIIEFEKVHKNLERELHSARASDHSFGIIRARTRDLEKIYNKSTELLESLRRLPGVICETPQDRFSV